MPKINIHVLPRIKSKKAKTLNITYKFQTTKLGNVLIGYYDEKVCHISFQDESTPNFDGIKQDFPQSVLTENTGNANNDFFDDPTDIDVVLTGTEFQVKIWKTLMEIEKGSTVSYEKMAEMSGNPSAVRAVANAIAKNKIAYLIPCHRVINKNGKINKYRWGAERKKMLLSYDKNTVL